MTDVLLLRHAKSSWKNPALDDRDRPLNKRGRRAAAEMGRWLADRGPTPDAILCSPARRTRETVERLGLGAEPRIVDAIYEATPSDLAAVLRAAEGGRILLVGHNPAIAVLAEALAAAPPDHPRFADYPTCALTVLRFDGPPAAITAGAGEVLDFVTPHDLAEL